VKIHDGIARFQQNVFPGWKDRFEALAEGQSPELLLVTCSDSRIDPALLTQTEPGELFVIRNAGNFVPPYGEGSGGEAATIEYGIQALGIQHIAVCGHTKCGAMAAARDPESAAGLPAVQEWIGLASEALDRSADLGESTDALTETVAANVLTQIDHLRTHPSVSAAEARGELTLHAWVYDFVRGELWVGDPDGRFRPLSPQSKAAGEAA